MAGFLAVRDCAGSGWMRPPRPRARTTTFSIFADLDARWVAFVTEGRSAQTVECFAADLTEHPPGAQEHPLAVAEELAEPVGDATP